METRIVKSKGDVMRLDYLLRQDQAGRRNAARRRDPGLWFYGLAELLRTKGELRDTECRRGG